MSRPGFIDHVGIGVPDLAAAKRYYDSLMRGVAFPNTASIASPRTGWIPTTSSLIGLHRQQIEPNTIDLIVLTHLHGDHCGGVPFLLLDAMLGSKWQTPLTIVGPMGSRAHLRALQDALFPGSGSMEFALQYAEVAPDSTSEVAGLKPVRWHLNYPDLVGLSANRIVLTHMHSNMLEHVDEVPEECAYDGYEIEL